MMNSGKVRTELRAAKKRLKVLVDPRATISEKYKEHGHVAGLEQLLLSTVALEREVRS